MVRTTWPSLPTRMNAFGAKTSVVAASLRPRGRLRLSMRPPPAAAPVARKLRRERVVSEACEMMRSRIMIGLPSLRLRRELDRLADARIGSAAADVAAHGVVDVGVGRIRLVCEKRRGRHDLS